MSEPSDMDRMDMETTMDTDRHLTESGSNRKGYLIERRAFVKGLAVIGATGILAGLSGCGFNEVDSSADKTAIYDLVVIGAGGAGMCAAIAASDAGVAKVLVIERASVCGGNTMSAISGMNASQTTTQTDAGVTDSNDLFTSETYAVGGSIDSVDLITTMCQNSSAAIDWLSGLGISLDNLATTYGSSVPRCHRLSDASATGLKLIPALATEISSRSIDVVYGQRATKLTSSNETGAVTGVIATDQDGVSTTYTAKAVVIASGGFAANSAMVAQYRPDLASVPAAGIASTSGDGISLATAIGAGTVGLDRILRFPTVESETLTPISEALRNQGAILVNTAGNRFCNEIDSYENLSNNIAAQDQGFAWLVFDQTISDVVKSLTADYIDKGLALPAGDIAGLASSMGVDATALQATVDAYNQAASGGTDALGRTANMSVLTTASWYAIKVSPCLFYTSGGLTIGTTANVLNAASTAIPGLYAAGEVTGGIHGSGVICGNPLTDLVVFGKLAGEQAAAYINGPSAGASPETSGMGASAVPGSGSNMASGVDQAPNPSSVPTSGSQVAYQMTGSQTTGSQAPGSQPAGSQTPAA